MDKDVLKELHKMVEEVFTESTPFDDCITPEEYLDLWQYARLRSAQELVALLTFGEMMNQEAPMDSFRYAMLNYLRDANRRNDEEEAVEASKNLEVLH